MFLVLHLIIGKARQASYLSYSGFSIKLYTGLMPDRSPALLISTAYVYPSLNMYLFITLREGGRFSETPDAPQWRSTFQ